MNPTRHHSGPAGPADGGLAGGNPVARSAAVRPSAVRSTAARSTAARRAVVGPVAVAVPLTVALALAGAGADWIGALWLTAVLWAIGASFVQALWRGLRYGDWSAFAYREWPRNDDDFGYTTRSGRYAYLRNHAEDDALMRDGDRFLQDHDHGDSLS